MVLRQRMLSNTFMVFDLLVMGGSFAFAACMYFSGDSASLERFLDTRVRFANILFFGIFSLFWHLIFRVFGVYRYRLPLSKRHELYSLCSAILVGALGLVLSAKIMDFRMIGPAFIARFVLLNLCAVLCGHFVMNFIFKKMRAHGRMARHLVIVGTNKRALSLARFFKTHPEVGYRVIGFVDDVVVAPELHGVENFDLDDSTALLTNFENFGLFIRKQAVDEVILCLPILSFYKQSAEVVALCEEHGITVSYASDLFTLKRNNRRHVEIINVYTGKMHVESNEVTMKRVFDVVLSCAGLIALLPVFVLIALLIKSTSRGPIFFTQTRIGKNKRKFTLYKFRTMVFGAEKQVEQVAHLNDMSGPILKIKDDPRITAVGRWLRRTSLDELPQLINVLFGDMSLVGPRPLTLRDFQGFQIDWHHRRFSVRPGLTCFWQIGGRNSIPFERWMELDAYYVDSWNLWTDIKILVKTIPAVVKGHGAT